ncbi:hypothetical protein M0R45_031167 [Rubus argutus]
MLSKGKLFMDHFCEKEQSSFLDYISSGFELNFIVAVDFTASNKDPRRSDSLHYMGDQLNSYQNAIMQVGEVIQFYDADKRFPAWGFGGMIGGAVSHCFNMDRSHRTATGSEDEGLSGSEVEGVEGIMSAYSIALHKASDLPLSILIVGVGNADFQQMEILDADNGQPLREELPGQFLTYMRSKGIKPLSPSNSKPQAKLLI